MHIYLTKIMLNVNYYVIKSNKFSHKISLLDIDLYLATQKNTIFRNTLVFSKIV